MRNTERTHDVVRAARPDTGLAIVHVRLSNTDRRVTMWAEDYSRIVEEHGLTPLFLNFNKAVHGCGYVRLQSLKTGNLVMVARLVKGAPPKGKVLRYRDGNTLNLCRENLMASGGLYAGTKKNRKRPEVAPDEFRRATL